MRRWKVTQTSYYVSPFIRTEPVVRVFFYRWRWLARLSQILNSVPPMGLPIAVSATLERSD